jgi:hypothetical protein
MYASAALVSPGSNVVVTDPVRNIQATEFATGLDIHVADPLRELALLPAAPESPYLTVTLDWTPNFEDPGRQAPEERRRSEQRNRPAEEPASRRPARTWLDKELKGLLDGLEPRSPQRANLEADIARIGTYLDSELDPAASGVYIVSAQGRDVFVPLALGVPIPTGVGYGPQPAIDALAHVAEDYATYGILVSDQERAELSFVTQGVRDRGVTLEGTLYPRKQAQGGPNQRRYQARADERVFHFARAVAGEVQAALREVEAEDLVLVGSRVFIDELLKQFPDDIAALVAGMVPMDLKPEPTGQALIDATAEIALKAERERETTAVDSVREVLGQGRAVAGAVDVLNALQAHQVMTLVVNEDFQGSGWADLTLPLYGLGPIPAGHPTGGDIANLVEVNLAEEFVRLALQSGGEIEMVHTSVPFDVDSPLHRSPSGIPRSAPAIALDEVGGVAAVLRYAS